MERCLALQIVACSAACVHGIHQLEGLHVVLVGCWILAISEGVESL